MRQSSIFVPMVILVMLGGCVDNEQSFYIEHAKAQPDPPECTVSSGDAVVSGYFLDLMTLSSPGTHFQVANSVMSQEDYGRGRAESNGIFVEGYELYTLIPELEGAIGGTEFFDYNHYIEPEATDLLYANLMSASTISQLRSSYQCINYTSSEMADAIFFDWWRDNYSELNGGAPVPQDIVTAANGTQNVLSNLRANRNLPEIMYAVVRFLGHTQGQKEVETQEFSVELSTHCGPIGGWEPCISNMCTAFCNDEAAYVQSCSAGVNAPMTCADYLAGNMYIIPHLVLGNDGASETQVESICDALGCI